MIIIGTIILDTSLSVTQEEKESLTRQLQEAQGMAAILHYIICYGRLVSIESILHRESTISDMKAQLETANSLLDVCVCLCKVCCVCVFMWAVWYVVCVYMSNTVCMYLIYM